MDKLNNFVILYIEKLIEEYEPLQGEDIASDRCAYMTERVEKLVAQVKAKNPKIKMFAFEPGQLGD